MTLPRRFTLAMAIIALALFFSHDANSGEPTVPVDPDAVPDVPAVEPVVLPQDVLVVQKAALRGTDASESIQVISLQQDRAMNGLVFVSPSVDSETTEYQRIYKSVPFNRAAYAANPNYRHDSTMEILTGNARHQTVINHNFEHKQPVQRISHPARPSRLLTPVSGLNYLWYSPLWFNRIW